MPEPILFKRNAEGDLAARVGDLEVGFFAENDGCYVVVWGTEPGIPCCYHDSECPEGKDRRWKGCPVARNCPYEFTKVIQENSTVMINEGTRDELEAKIRDMFVNEHDGSDHDSEWPQPAASMFAAAPWAFDNA